MLNKQISAGANCISTKVSPDMLDVDELLGANFEYMEKKPWENWVLGALGSMCEIDRFLM